MKPTAIVTITPAELETLVRRAVAAAFKQAPRESKAIEYSLVGAARAAHRRTADVQAALRSKALPGSFDGRRWRVQDDDLRAWTKAGCPLTPRRGA